MKELKFNTDNDFKEVFYKANFILFDQIFWQYSEDFINRYNVDLFYIGRNYFKKKENCPILIDLRKLTKKEKEDMYNYICTTELETESPLDRMKISQNIFICDNLEELKSLLAEILILNDRKQKKLFRVYDPRVSFFLPYLFEDNKFKKHKDIILNFLKLNVWYINIFGAYVKLNDLNYDQKDNKIELADLVSKIRMSNIDYLNVFDFIDDYKRDI